MRSRHIEALAGVSTRSMRHNSDLRIFPTRQPMLWAALAFAAGIVAGSRLWRPPMWWLDAIIVFVVGAWMLKQRRSRFSDATSMVAVAILLLFLGAWNIQVQPRLAAPQLPMARGLSAEIDSIPDPSSEGTPEIAGPPANDFFRFTDGNEIVIVAHVIREGDIRDAGPTEYVQRIDVQTEQLASTPISVGLRLGVYSRRRDTTTPAMPLFRYGQRLRFTAKLRLPHNFRNPGAFDYEAYLAQNGISVLGSTKAEEVEVLPGFTGSRFELWRTRIHRSLIQKIHSLWPAPQAGLIDAMVIGESAFIDRDSRTDFQRSGTYHILVVSGMNVSILAAVIFWVLRRLRASEVLSAVLTVISSVAYALLTNVGSPVWRAVLMMAMYLCARLLYRERSRLNALGAAALAIMVFDPATLLGASFQMTFLSVLIIAAICVPFLERTVAPYVRALRCLDSVTYDIALPPKVAQFRLDLRLVAGRIVRFIGPKLPMPVMARSLRTGLAAWEIVVVSAVMQVGLAVPMACYFHRATVIGVPSNALAVPLTGVLMAATVPAVALAYISLPIAKLLAWVTGVALSGITGSLHTLGKLRAADLRVPTLTLAAILIALSGLH
jgi:competence protein ComEC